MSGRRPTSRAPPPPPPPEEEDEEFELDADEEDDEMEGMEDGPDMFDALSGFLTTEEGESIAEVMLGTKTATEEVARQLAVHNKILLRILSVLQKKDVESTETSKTPVA